MFYGSPTVPPDPDPVIGFEQTSLSVPETAGDVDICVVLLTPATRPVLALVDLVAQSSDTATGIFVVRNGTIY